MVRLHSEPEAGQEVLPALRSGADLCIQLAYAIQLKVAENNPDIFEKSTQNQPGTSLAERARLLWDTTPLGRRPRLLINLAGKLLAKQSSAEQAGDALAGLTARAAKKTKPSVGTDTSDVPTSKPKPSFFKKIWGLIAPWLVPAVFVGLLPVGIVELGAGKTLAAAGLWMTANGVLGMIAMLSIRAHWFTLIASVTLGPLSALHPFIGSGFVCAWAEYRSRRPRWNDLKTLGADLRRVRAWLDNRALRVMLAWVAGSIANFLSNAVGVWLVVRLLTA